MADHEWRDRAKCIGMDPDVFHPTQGGDHQTPKAVCNGEDGDPVCPVREACLDYAVQLGTAALGVWGGTTDAERERKRRKRRRRAVAVPIREGDGDSRHGSKAGYWAGCRCGSCKVARADYARQHRYRGRVG